MIVVPGAGLAKQSIAERVTMLDPHALAEANTFAMRPDVVGVETQRRQHLWCPNGVHAPECLRVDLAVIEDAGVYLDRPEYEGIDTPIGDVCFAQYGIDVAAHVRTVARKDSPAGAIEQFLAADAEQRGSIAADFGKCLVEVEPIHIHDQCAGLAILFVVTLDFGEEPECRRETQVGMQMDSFQRNVVVIAALGAETEVTGVDQLQPQVASQCDEWVPVLAERQILHTIQIV